MKHWLVCVLISLTLSAIIGSFMFPSAIKGQRQQDALESRGVQVKATVIAIAPSQHAQCTYDFVAENRHYQSTGGGCADIPVGNGIVVYYLPDDPNVSTNGIPGTYDFGGWIFVIVCVFVMPAFLVFAMFRRAFGLRSRHN